MDWELRNTSLPRGLRRAFLKRPENFSGPKTFRGSFRVPESAGGAGRPSHNALRINYIINCRLSRDPLVVSDVHGVKSTVS